MQKRRLAAALPGGHDVKRCAGKQEGFQSTTHSWHSDTPGLMIRGPTNALSAGYAGVAVAGGQHGRRGPEPEVYGESDNTQVPPSFLPGFRYLLHLPTLPFGAFLR